MVADGQLEAAHALVGSGTLSRNVWISSPAVGTVPGESESGRKTSAPSGDSADDQAADLCLRWP